MRFINDTEEGIGEEEETEGGEVGGWWSLGDGFDGDGGAAVGGEAKLFKERGRASETMSVVLITEKAEEEHREDEDEDEQFHGGTKRSMKEMEIVLYC